MKITMKNNMLKDSLGVSMKVLSEGTSTDVLQPVYLQCIAITPDIPNNNGRIYEEELVDKILATRMSPEQLKSNPLFMEIVHPAEDQTGEINSERIAAQIIKAWKAPSNELVVLIELLPEIGNVGAKVLYNLVVKRNAVPGISIRGFGKYRRGNTVDTASYKFVTIDITFNPSNIASFAQKLNSTEALDISEYIGESTEEELMSLSESFKAGDKSLVKLIENKNANVKNSNKMEDPNKELLEKVADLSGKLAKSESENEQLKKESSDVKEELAAKTESLKTVEGHYAKCLAITESVIDELKISDQSRVDLEVQVESLNDTNKVLTESLKTTEAHYNKSVAVISTINESVQHNKVVEMVESKLGEGAYEKYSNLFENTSYQKAETLVTALSENIKPTVTKPFVEQFRNGAAEGADSAEGLENLTESEKVDYERRKFLYAQD